MPAASLTPAWARLPSPCPALVPWQRTSAGSGACERSGSQLDCQINAASERLHSSFTPLQTEKPPQQAVLLSLHALPSAADNGADGQTNTASLTASHRRHDNARARLLTEAPRSSRISVPLGRPPSSRRPRRTSITSSSSSNRVRRSSFSSESRHSHVLKACLPRPTLSPACMLSTSTPRVQAGSPPRDEGAPPANG